MNKQLYIIFGIIFLVLIGNVNAWSTDVLYNGTTSYTTENVTLNNNFERYLKVPTGTYLINAYLNLTGYGVGNTEFIYQENANETSVDNGDPYGIIYENYTKLTGATNSSLLMLKMSNFTYNFSLSNCWGTDTKLQFMFTAEDYYGRSGAYLQNNTAYCKVDGSWIFINNTHFETPAGTAITASGDYYLRAYDGNWNTGSTKGHSGQWYYAASGACNDALIYEDAMIWDIKPVYPSDVFFSYAETNLYYLPSGIFNTTNKTTNLASGINTALSDGCICSECILSGGYCSIPFIFDFTGDAGGILNYNNLIFSDIGLTENSQTYNPTTSSNKLETFIINFTYSSYTYTSVSGVLNYNGTNYAGTLSGSGNTKLLTVTLTSSSSTGSYPFYWNISLTNSSGVNYFKSNNYTQTINPLVMNRCNSVYNVTFINFTVKDAETPTTLIPSIFKVTFNYGVGNTLSTYSYQETTASNSSFPFCFLPSDLTYLVDASIEYEATGYSKNYYYLNDASLTNATQNITLYLLNSSKATLTVLKAQTETQTALSDVYIQIQRYDVGTDTYYTVGMAKTDFAGEDLAYLNWYDTYYKYILTQDGSVIYIANSFKISSSPVTFTISEDITFDYDKFLNIIYTLTFNNATNNFILTYSVPSGTITSACLRVDKRTIKNDTNICNTCETSSSATIYCNINAYGNGTYIATFYAKGSLGVIDSIVTLIGVSNRLYDLIGNVDGTMYAILFSALCMVMFFISPVLGIIGLLLGMIGGMAIGFSPVNYMEFLGIGIVGVIIIMILKR